MSKHLTTFEEVIKELGGEQGDQAVAHLVGVREVTVRSWRLRKRFPCATYKVMTDALEEGVTADPALWGMKVAPTKRSGSSARRSPKDDGFAPRGRAA